MKVLELVLQFQEEHFAMNCRHGLEIYLEKTQLYQSLVVIIKR